MPTSLQPVRSLAQALLIGALVVFMMGCEPTYAPRKTIDLRPMVVHVADHHGGTRHCTIVHEGVWYQSLGPELVVYDGDRGLRVTSVESRNLVE